MSIGGVNGPKFDPTLKATEKTEGKPEADNKQASIFNQKNNEVCNPDNWSTGGFVSKDCD